jgi:hypothetical protein
VDSDSLRWELSFEERLSERNQFSLDYSFEHARNYVDADSHFAFLGWVRTFSPRTAVLVDAGASYTLRAGDVGLQQPWSFYGGLSLNRQVKRSSLTAYYRREVIPIFGLAGLRLADRLGLEATIPLGRDWNLMLTGGYVVGPSSSEVESSRLTSGDAGVSLAWRAARHLSVSMDGRYRRRSATSTVPGIDDFAAGLFVSLVSGQASATPGHGKATR